MIKLSHIQKYSLEDWMLLKEDIKSSLKQTANKDHSGIIQSLPSLLHFINYIIDNKEILTHTEKDYELNSSPWVSLRNRKLLFKSPLDRMPIHINNQKNSSKFIALWRLKISK
jgi:hypothetical protein